jgi:hypothetical protein
VSLSVPLLVGSLLVGAIVAPRPARAQESPAAREASIARAKAALAPIAAIVGRWEGDAYPTRGPGQTMHILQQEDIAWGAGGTVLMIRGTGRSLEAADKGAIVFEAAAIAWFDPALGRVRMQTHTDGRTLVVDPEIRPDTLIWGFDTPGGRVRYTIAVGNDTFHEIGEFLRPGAPPVRTLEMRLRRVAP